MISTRRREINSLLPGNSLEGRLVCEVELPDVRLHAHVTEGIRQQRLDRQQHLHIHTVESSVRDPDPHVFGPPRFEFISHSEVWIRILPFSQKDVERTEIMLAK
jgi:hypothetical protein